MAQQSAAARRKAVRREEDPVEWFDVPAAVLCAVCGQGDCAGCATAREDASGIIAIVPWERPGAGPWSRLWQTANAATQGAEAFFATLPDGAIGPAVRFAILAELLAVASFLVLLLPLVLFAMPALAAEILHDAVLSSAILRWTALGVPAFALWMVVAHAAHGVALDAGARRHGGLPQRRRALRFGLYACGWDLVRGPLGVVMTIRAKGLRAALAIAELVVRAPDNAALAFLHGVYGLPGDAVARARRAGLLSAVVIAIASGAAVVVTVFVGLFG